MSSSSKSIAAQETPPPGVPATISRQRAQRRRSKDRHKRGFMIGANFSSALDALWANRLRSLLTTLGIVIGVAAVIAVVTLTQGATTLLNQQLASLGTNVIVIFPGTGSGVQSLSLEDAVAVTKVPHVKNASPVLNIRGQAVFGNQNW